VNEDLALIHKVLNKHFKYVQLLREADDMNMKVVLGDDELDVHWIIVPVNT
jgi:hypothetical protein